MLLGMLISPHFQIDIEHIGRDYVVTRPNSRSTRLCTWSGIGVNQISTSRPT